jgi:hypothetical protein
LLMTRDEVFNRVSRAVEEAILKISKLDYDERVHKEIIRKLEGYIYSNVLINFDHNLTAEHMRELGIGSGEASDIQGRFAGLFDSAKKGDDGISEEQFRNFRTYVKTKHGAYLLLREVEKRIRLKECRDVVRSFQSEYKSNIRNSRAK